MKGANRHRSPFSIKLDCVAVNGEAVEGVITCVEDFVRDPLFTHKSFYSDSGVAMLKDAVAVAGSVIVGEDFNPWSVFGDGCNQQDVSHLQSCPEKVVFWRKASQHRGERWFGGPSAGSGFQSSNVVRRDR